MLGTIIGEWHFPKSVDLRHLHRPTANSHLQGLSHRSLLNWTPAFCFARYRNLLALTPVHTRLHDKLIPIHAQDAVVQSARK